ncbi:outer membrane protein [Bradyrhizobium sp.]|uniref:outer membrane protein n=1 Tax=Bradyrhizobium sp. TaxID=376 RepID=UPI003BE2D6B4
MTKNITLGAITALLLGTTAAIAADLPMKAAPPPVQIYNWTGFYIGAAAGGSIGGSDHVDQATGFSDASGYNVKGGLIGGTVGYNWQMSNIVVGFEGDASWVAERGVIPDVGIVAQNDGFVDGTGQSRFSSFTNETWLATARGRVGYAVNNLLFYGTGGYAGAGVGQGIYDNAHNVLVSSSSTRSGWTAGGGLEWGFAPNWSAKFEWLYMKFNTVALNTAFAEGPRTVPFDDNVIRFGVNYRFGGPGPVVAKY